MITELENIYMDMLLEETQSGHRLDPYEFTKMLAGETKLNVMHNGIDGNVFNYTTDDGVEVSIKEDIVAPEINGVQVSGDIELDLILNVKKSREGYASKELERITKEADKRDMSIILNVDPEKATRGLDVKGPSAYKLIKWYEKYGFIFDEFTTYGYRPRKSEDSSKFIRETMTVDINDIPDTITTTLGIAEDVYDIYGKPNDEPAGYIISESPPKLFYYDGNSVKELQNIKIKEVSPKRHPQEFNKIAREITNIHTEINNVHKQVIDDIKNSEVRQSYIDKLKSDSIDKKTIEKMIDSNFTDQIALELFNKSIKDEVEDRIDSMHLKDKLSVLNRQKKVLLNKHYYYDVHQLDSNGETVNKKKVNIYSTDD